MQMDWAHVVCCRIDVGMGTGTGVGAGAYDRVKGWGWGLRDGGGKRRSWRAGLTWGRRLWARVVSALWVKITAG